MKKRNVLIVDPHDRRSTPSAYFLSNYFDVHFLVPIRKVTSLEYIIRIILKFCKPRGTKSYNFLSFREESKLLQKLINTIETGKYDSVLAFSERSTALLIKVKAKIKNKALIPFGTMDQFDALNDKFEIAEVCKKLNVPTPKYFKVAIEEDLSLADDFQFPVVLKCTKASGINESLRICDNKSSLIQGYKDLKKGEGTYSFFPRDIMVVQEFVKGKIYDGNFVVYNGEVVEGMTQLRIWTIPPSGGPGAYNQTVHVPELFEYAKKVFQEIKWTGPVNMEYIKDATSGQYKLIEVNPRFWGTLGLSFKAGYNFPKTLLDKATDNSIKVEQKVNGNVFFKWLLQDTLVAEVFQGKKTINVLANHIKQIFSSENENFKYSVRANLLLSIPYIVKSFNVHKKKNTAEAKKSFADRLFA